MVIDAPSVFMEEPVVEPAQQDQIVQIGRTTVRPMSPMMGVDEIPGSTTRELTASIPIPELRTTGPEPDPPDSLENPSRSIPPTYKSAGTETGQKLMISKENPRREVR